MKKFISLLLISLLLVTMLVPTAFAAAEVRYTVNGETKEGTLIEAMEAVSPRGGEIVLLQDIHVPKSVRTFGIKMQSSFTLDLNGHVLSGYRPIHLAGKGILSTSLITDTVGTGAIVAEHIAISVTEGGLHLKGVQIYSKAAQAISYDDYSGDYNIGNIIEDSVVVSSAWGALSFNHTERTQEKACFIIRNSTLVNTKTGNAIVHQKAAVGAQLELREGVKLLSPTKGNAIIQTGITVYGEPLTKSDSTADGEIAGHVYSGMTVFETPAVATTAPRTYAPMPKTYSAWDTYFVSETPEEPETPAEPAKPAEPETPAEPAKPEEPAVEPPAEVPAQQPQQQDSSTIIAVAAAAVVVALCAVAVAVVVVLKYTKKMKDE